MEFLLFAIVGVGIYQYFEAGKKFLDKYKVKFLDAKFNSRETAKSVYQILFFNLKIQVQNETDFVGTLNTAKIELWYGNKKLGFVDLKNAVTIKAVGLTVVEIPVRVKTINLLGSIPELIQLVSSGKDLVLHVKGGLNFAAGTYKVNENVTVPLLK